MDRKRISRVLWNAKAAGLNFYRSVRNYIMRLKFKNSSKYSLFVEELAGSISIKETESAQSYLEYLEEKYK